MVPVVILRDRPPAIGRDCGIVLLWLLFLVVVVVVVVFVPRRNA